MTKRSKCQSALSLAARFLSSAHGATGAQLVTLLRQGSAAFEWDGVSYPAEPPSDHELLLADEIERVMREDAERAARLAFERGA